MYVFVDNDAVLKKGVVERLTLIIIIIMADQDLSPYTIPVDTPISKLDCLEAFQGLSEKEKLYAYHLSKASWEGALICLLQTSPESAGIFLLFQRVFGGQSLSSLRDIALNGCSLTEAEYNVSFENN